MIACRQLSIGYRGCVLLDGLTFDIPAGSFWALVGRNGSGKSTLLSTLAGLLPAHTGRVTICGRELGQWQRTELATKLGFLPQYTRVVFPFTVAEFIAFGRVPWRKLRNISNTREMRSSESDSTKDAQATAAALAAVDIASLHQRKLPTLSGGEAQRVWLGQLLAQQTDILLLDEPLAHLDLLHQLAVMELLRSLACSGAAVVAVLHDLALAWRFCDHLLLLGPASYRVITPDDSFEGKKALTWAYGVDFSIDPQLGPVPQVRGMHPQKVVGR